ncbi:MAG: purine-binding chemotaxis protein CheW [Abitibacteriaceae bacterium]|nr:purine-binding chemotaxis protein CheW [Abditibacteriaceae bacterium]MBV9867399.1 purine-binding chemotaxis protein CheW [Abditibacteriaceae bacterium]
MVSSTELSTLDAPAATYLTFGLANSIYAVDALVVREILWLPDITPVGETPPYIVGVVNIRGKVVPVMDLNLRLGRPAQPYCIDDKVIVLEWEGHLAGMIVNEVRNVRQINPEHIEVASLYAAQASGTANRSSAEGYCIAGVARVGENIIMLLHLASLLRLPDEISLDDERGAWPLGNQDCTFYPEATLAEREILRERARSLMQPIAAQDFTGLLPVAVVALSGEYFGIDLHLVREFASLRHVTPVPCCPAHIVGQMNLRGDILTLIDIRGVLQIPEVDLNDQIKVAVIGFNELLVGIPVDEVLDVVYLRPADILPVPAAVQALGDDYLTGTASHGSKMLGLLDLAKVLTQSHLVVYEEV